MPGTRRTLRCRRGFFSRQVLGRAPSSQFAQLTSALSSMSDSDPPPYTPERPVAWILLFIHHMVKCGVCDIVPQDLSASTGGELISSADPHLRQKLARRMGFAQDPDDVALICAIDEKDEASKCAEATSMGVGASAASGDSRTSVLEKPPSVDSSKSRWRSCSSRKQEKGPHL